MDRVDGKKTPNISYVLFHIHALSCYFATVRHMAYAGLLPRRHRLITIQLLLDRK